MSLFIFLRDPRISLAVDTTVHVNKLFFLTQFRTKVLVAFSLALMQHHIGVEINRIREENNN